MQYLKVGNRRIYTPLYEIILDIQKINISGKLKSIKPRGSNIRVTCPVHKGGLENKPSADVYVGDTTDNVEYGWFKCFTCDSQGPFTRFVAECLDISEIDAKNWLIDNYADDFVDETITLPEMPTISNSRTSSYLPESVLNNFESFHPYMIERKLSKRIIDLFEVKYNPHSKSLVFPVRDENRNLVMLTERSVNTKYFYIEEDKEKPLYLLYYLIDNMIDTCIITEGQIDALTACSYGFPCVATIGAISDHQINLINKSGIRVLYVMFDNDAAGRRFTFKLKKALRKDILIVDVPIIIPGKKDINDLSQDEFYACIENAEKNLW